MFKEHGKLDDTSSWNLVLGADHLPFIPAGFVRIGRPHNLMKQMMSQNIRLTEFHKLKLKKSSHLCSVFFNTIKFRTHAMHTYAEFIRKGQGITIKIASCESEPPCGAITSLITTAV
jgi:hypothetical protein